MGLGGAKRKQRLVGSATTKNTAWVEDSDAIGQKLLSQMGWSAGQGVGETPSSRTAPIKSVFKMDNKGIGSQRAEREFKEKGGGADRWIGGGGELGSIFDRLNATPTATPPMITSEDEAESSAMALQREENDKKDKKKRKREAASEATAASSADESKKSSQAKRSKKEETKEERRARKASEKENRKKQDAKKVMKEALETANDEHVPVVVRNASRAKFLRAKRQLHGDSVSMNEILGISSGSNSPMPASSPSPAPVSAALESEAEVELTTTADGGRESSSKADKADKKAAKEKKRLEKAAKKAAKLAATSSAEPAQSEAQPIPNPGVQNTVSSVSVHDYLTRRLMLKKAQVMRKQKSDQEAVWGRLNGSGGTAVGVMVE